jgi:hypothetical protein
VLRIDRGGKTPVAENVGSYEFANNPAGDNLDSDPYGIAWSPLGLAVADAAGNSLLLLHPNGRLSTIATFGATFYGGHAAQAVPTTVVWHDGAFYVGELGGGGTPEREGSRMARRPEPGQDAGRDRVHRDQRPRVRARREHVRERAREGRPRGGRAGQAGAAR